MSLNQYFFGRSIGKGAYATVYEALDIERMRAVAIKVTNRTLKSTELRLVKKEIDILMSISHPNIIHLHSHIQRGKTWYLVLSHCSGGNLHEYMKIHIQLEEKEVQTIAYFLGDALQYLEARKIAHRDIKLANILIDQNGTVKLADLGFAKSTEDGEMLKSRAGTESTMAPEVLNSHEQPNYTTKCDVWSFGIILYQLLYSKNPFYGARFNVSYQKLTFPNETSVSPEVKDLIRKCLVVDPSRRISAEQIMNHPWILSCQPKNPRFYLSPKPFDLAYLCSSYNQFQLNIKAILLKQYDLSIVKAVQLFKIQYNLQLNNLKYFTQKIFLFFKQLNYIELLPYITNIISQKLQELKGFRVKMQLPCKQFDLSKHCKDLADRNRQMTGFINQSMQRFLLEMKGNSHDIVDNKQYQRTLMYQLLMKGEGIQGSREYTTLWNLIKMLCKLISMEFRSFTVKLNYHESVIQEARQVINQAKYGMDSCEFDKLVGSSEEESAIQKIDILVVQIISNTDQHQCLLDRGLVEFLIETASLI